MEYNKFFKKTQGRNQSREGEDTSAPGGGKKNLRKAVEKGERSEVTAKVI